MARQNLAVLERDYIELLSKIHKVETGPDHLFACLSELIALIDDIQAIGNSATDGYAEITDVDLHGWTVTFAYETLEKLRSRIRGNNTRNGTLQAIELRVIEELEQMVRGHRQVIRVGVYKHAFAKYYSKHQQRILLHYFKQADQAQKDKDKAIHAHVSKLVSWIEESSSRELLDMVVARRREMQREIPRSPETSTATGTPSPEIAEDSGDSPAPQGGIPRCLRKANDMKDRVMEACIESERQFDDFAKSNPIAAAQIPPDIHEKAQAFARKNNSAIIRFFQMGEGQDKEGHFGAVVYAPNSDKAIAWDLLKKTEADGAKLSTHISNALQGIDTILKATTKDEVNSALEGNLPKIGEAAGTILQTLCPTIAESEGGVENIIVIPVGKLWKLPFHTAIVKGQLLCQTVTILYSMSISSLIEHGRWEGVKRKIQPERLGICTSLASETSPSTDQDNEIFGELILNRTKKFFQKTCLGPYKNRENVTVASSVTQDELKNMLQSDSFTVLYLGCHGVHYEDDLNRSCLVFHNSENSKDTTLLTPEQIAMLPVTREIPLVILAACVSGQGVGLPGGEVSGFYRALAALGAHACMMSFWPVITYHVDTFAAKAIDFALTGNKSPLECYRKTIAEMIDSQEIKSPHLAIMKLCCLGMFV